MSFGAGMGAGMGAGIGCGIAIGVSSGQKKAVEQIRAYLEQNELTIHDRMGKEVPIESTLDSAVCKTGCESGNNKSFLVAAVILGFLAMAGAALVAYLVYAGG